MTHQTQEDPIIKLIDHELGKLNTILELKTQSMDFAADAQARHREAVLSYYYITFKDLVHGPSGLARLKKEFSDKQFRKEVYKWALMLMREAHIKLLLAKNINPSVSGSRQAQSDIAVAIINAFKKL